MAGEFKCDNECRKLKPKVVENYDKMLSYFVKWLEGEGTTEAEAVTAPIIRKFLKTYADTGHTVNYINDILKVIKVFYKYMENEEYIEPTKNPARKVRNYKGGKTFIKGFNQAELTAMIAHWNGRSYYEIRNKVMLMLFWDTGIRCAELMNLTIDQLHSDYILIHGKGDKDRMVPKSPMLSKWLMKYLTVRKGYFADRPHLTNLLFLSKNGKKLTNEAVDVMIKETAKAVGVREEVRWSAHTIRHAYAEFSLTHGMDIYTLSRLLGHSNISTTQIYLDGLKNSKIVSMGAEKSPLMTPLG